MIPVLNFCTSALDMLSYSMPMAVRNSGTPGAYFMLWLWEPTWEVAQWAEKNRGVAQCIRRYHTDHSISYVANLRRMFNLALDAAFKEFEYACLINTDMAFYRDWLAPLVEYATPKEITNSVHITPIRGPHVVTANLGEPIEGVFQDERFERMAARLRANRVEDGPLDRCGTFPWVLHRSWWQRFGPWELEAEPGREAPDRAFFRRCEAGGARFLKCHRSVVYHHEAVERRRRRAEPLGSLREGR